MLTQKLVTSDQEINSECRQNSKEK